MLGAGIVLCCTLKPDESLPPRFFTRMTTRLDKPLKREVLIAGDPYVVTLSPEGMKLVPKGRRKGYELSWSALISGDEALARALNASLARAPEPATTSSKKRKKARAN